jgi:hypothetical protein
MFRKLILSAVMATGTVTGLALTPTAAEANPLVGYRQHRFEVLVHRGYRWENRGVFHNRFEAERVANRLRHEGFRVDIREF